MSFKIITVNMYKYILYNYNVWWDTMLNNEDFTGFGEFMELRRECLYVEKNGTGKGCFKL